MTLLLLSMLGCGRRIHASSGDAEAWPELLAQAVDEQGLVDYALLKQERPTLEAYVHSLGQVTPLEPDQAFARGINAYNAFVLLGVLDQDIQGSVRDLSFGVFPAKGVAFFGGLRFQFQGSWVSLNKLETRGLRQSFDDPRVHAAINCASMGCPPLSPTLYSGEDLDQQLDAAMQRFVAERNRIEGDTAVFSSILDWFQEDFVGPDGDPSGLCLALAPYDPAYAALHEQGCPHRFEPYDWSLNQQAP